MFFFLFFSSKHRDKTQKDYESEKLRELNKFLKAKIINLIQEIETFRDHKLRILTLDFISKNEETWTLFWTKNFF